MRLIDLDEGRARDAAIDGLWQALMLAGAFEEIPMNVELLSYEAPTYYGMLVACLGACGEGGTTWFCARLLASSP